MQTDLKVDFHGVDPTEALRANIREHVDHLEQLYRHLTACHVSVEAPGHQHRKGGLYHVRIRLSLPSGREVNIGVTPPSDGRHADMVFALNDAFRRARRRVQGEARMMNAHVKSHETAPTGIIKRFDPNTGFGFIEAPDGHEIYFDRNSVLGSLPFKIRQGLRVSFVEQAGDKRPQASTVRLLEKRALR